MRVLLWCGLLRCFWLSLGFSYVVSFGCVAFFTCLDSLWLPAWWLFLVFWLACAQVVGFCFIGLSFSFASLVGLNCLLLLFYQVVCFGLLPLSCIFRGGAARFSFFQGAFGLLFCP